MESYEGLRFLVVSYLDLMGYLKGRKVSMVRRVERLSRKTGWSVDIVRRYLENISAAVRVETGEFIKGIPPRTATDKKLYELIGGLVAEGVGGSFSSDRISVISIVKSWLERFRSIGEVIQFDRLADLCGFDERGLIELLDLMVFLDPSLANDLIDSVVISIPEPEGEDLICDEEGGFFLSGIAQKAISFALVETRPEQAAFRRKVFLRCGGACVVTGCDVSEALDAAHLRGKSWREGDNAGEDGILLRKDVHALYDCGLVDIADGGEVWLAPQVTSYYGALAGKKVEFALGEA